MSFEKLHLHTNKGIKFLHWPQSPHSLSEVDLSHVKTVQFVHISITNNQIATTNLIQILVKY